MTEKMTHRLDDGVIVVEIKQALSAEDFDALAVTADAWIQAKGSLKGLVLHAHHFPGWESLQGVIKHIRFVKDHHRQIEKVALVTDARLASLFPHVVEHFVGAELKTFGYDKLADAIVWARSTSG
jgi:hypothetical protein